MEGIARRQGGEDRLRGEPALKESNCKLAVQQRMKRRTGTHSTVEIRGALSQRVVLLGSPQRPQQAKADGDFSKRKAEGIHDYLAGLKFRLVELFGEHAPRRCASHSSLVRSQMGHLPGDTPGNGLAVEAPHHLLRCPEAVLFEFTEGVSVRATAESVWSRLSDLESWWLESNPEHISLEIGSPDKRVAVGTEIAFKERVAGIKASASGTVTSLIPGVAATWTGRHITATVAFASRFRKASPGALNPTWAARFCPLMCERAFVPVPSDDSSNGIPCTFFTSLSVIASTHDANWNT